MERVLRYIGGDVCHEDSVVPPRRGLPAIESAEAVALRTRLADTTAALRTVEAGLITADARELECRAWIAESGGERAAATDLYLAALDRVDAVERHDRLVEAHCLRRLGILALERLDAGMWSVVARRRSRFDWSGRGVGEARFDLALTASTYACDVEGDLDRAATEARTAEHLSVTLSQRALAACARAMVARAAGEAVSQRDHVRAALALFDSCEPVEVGAEQGALALNVALEAACGGFRDEARAAFARYDRPHSDGLHASADDPGTAAHVKFVEAQMCRARGDDDEANNAFKAAFVAFRALKLTRRSIIAGLQIARSGRESRSYDGFISLAVERLGPQSWIRRLAADSAMRSVASGLTPTQRELIACVCDGRTNGEIALLRGRSENTVRNQIARLFELFDVRSRSELTAVAVRRGLDRGSLDSSAT